MHKAMGVRHSMEVSTDLAVQKMAARYNWTEVNRVNWAEYRDAADGSAPFASITSPEAAVLYVFDH